MTRKRFIFVIIRSLLYANGLPNIRDIDFHLSSNDNEASKYWRHFPQLVNGFENYYSKKRYVHIKPECNLCIKKTIFCCKDCDNGFNKIHLCLDCFESYHKDLLLKLEAKRQKKKMDYATQFN